MSDVPSNLIPTRVTQLPLAPTASEDSLMMIVYEGNSYQIRVGDLLAVSGVPISRQVIAGTGLTGGGALSSNVTLSVAVGGIGTTQLSSTGVSAGVYGSATSVPVITIDSKGRVTAATTTPVTVSGYVPVTREIIAGDGLTGGGTLNNNVTLSAKLSSEIPKTVYQSGSAGTSDTFSREDHRHPSITLSSTDQVTGVLGLSNGGTARSIVADAGAIIWSGADGMYVGPVGASGQVLVSGGEGEYSWGSALIVTDQPANYIYASPTSGAAGATTFRPMVNADLPSTSVVASTYGSSSSFPTFTVNSKGVLTSASTVDLNTVTVGKATNVAGGDANKIVFNSAANITSFIDAPTVANTFLEWSGSAFQWSTNPLGTVTSVALSLPSQLSVSGSPITTSGTLSASWVNQTQKTFFAAPNASTGTPTFRVIEVSDVPILNQDTTGNADTATNADHADASAKVDHSVTFNNSGTGNASGTSFDGSVAVTVSRNTLGAASSGVNSDITSLSGITSGISTPEYIDFDTSNSVTRATGRLWWDSSDGIQTLNLGMYGSNATMQIGEEIYYRIKASADIAEGQVVMFTGTVGASGALTGAPASGLTAATASYIMGVATETILNNQWGYVTQFGLVRGIDTTGGAESWVNGQILYYDPSVAGGLTKNVPTAPNAKVQVAAVVYASGGGAGSLFIRPSFGGELGQYEGNVNISGIANNDVLLYNGTNARWQNTAASGVTVGYATNVYGGASNKIVFNTAANTTSFIDAPTVANTYLEWSGSAFQWSANPLGTVTSVDVSGGTTGLTFSGGPITTSGTISMAGTLGIANGGTGTVHGIDGGTF